MIDLIETIPTLVPDMLREAAHQARTIAADPVTRMDDLNPYIIDLWLIVAEECDRSADLMDRRFLAAVQAPRQQAG